VSERIVKLLAGVVPKVTPVVERRFVPLIVTMFSRDAGWLVGEREVMSGAATVT
jgi:hypothetical protein